MSKLKMSKMMKNSIFAWLHNTSPQILISYKKGSCCPVNIFSVSQGEKFCKICHTIMCRQLILLCCTLKMVQMVHFMGFVSDGTFYGFFNHSKKYL